MRAKQLLIAGALISGLGVAVGAMGSHALKDILLQNGRTDTFEIAVKYQLYHGLALLVIGILASNFKGSKVELPGFLILLGMGLFSGSLYILSLSEMRWVVYVTPIGGVIMIAGWILLIFRLFRL